MTENKGFKIHFMVRCHDLSVLGYKTNKIKRVIKGALSGLGRFLAAESPLKVIKNAFYFTSEALFILKIFKFLS